MSRTVTRIAIAAALILLVVLFLWLQSCSRERTADVRADVAEGQQGAAIESGSDAISTVGNRQTADVAGDRTVTETRDAVRDAPDANSASAAGRNGLCALAAYRNRPECKE